MQNCIAAHRLARGLTRAQLARAIGADAATIWRWEERALTPSCPMLVRLGALFGVRPYELVPALGALAPAQTPGASP